MSNIPTSNLTISNIPTSNQYVLETCLQDAIIQEKNVFVDMYCKSFPFPLLEGLHRVVNSKKKIFETFLNLNKYKNLEYFIEETFQPNIDTFLTCCKSSGFWDYEFKELFETINDSETKELFQEFLEILRDKNYNIGRSA